MFISANRSKILGGHMADADLRPMTLGEVLDRTFSLYRSNFWLFAGIMALPLILNLLFNIGFSVWNRSTQLVLHGSQGRQIVNPQYFLNVAIGAFLGGALYLIVLGVAHGATIFAVSDLYLAREATVRAAFSRVNGRFLRLVGVEILVGLLLMVGFIALIFPGVILMCRTVLSVPVAMLEDESPASAISRSMDLTKGFGMQMFLIILLVWALAWVTTVIFQMPFIVLATMQKTGQQLPLIWQILQHLATFVSETIIGPIGTIAFCLMYYNLRVRKEAFDLQHLMASLGPASTPSMETPPAPTTA
jgi:hypothetical protein